MPRLKGLDFEIASGSMRLHEGRKMILNVKLLVRELTPYVGQEESSRDRKESPFPRANELPSFPRGRILHGARLDGRRSGEGKMEILGERLEALRSCLFGLLSHISYPDYVSYSLFFHVFVPCAAFAVHRAFLLLSRSFISLLQLRKAIPSKTRQPS